GAAGAGGQTAEETLASSVSYYDGLIEFQFAQEYVVGRFVNGDYWVHNHGGDVVITAITPTAVGAPGGAERVMNGTMLNPANSTTQGYDSSARDMGFDANLNVDPAFTGQDLVVSPSSSVIKGISTASSDGRPILADAAVLTVLSATPLKDAFRPPYVGQRSVVATAAELDYSQLGTHARLGGEPDIDSVASRYERVWLEHCTSWVSRDIHPANHMPAYGRDLARSSAEGLVMLQLDYSDAEKQRLLVGLVQYGIDIYGIAAAGGAWDANGGHNLGRKMPLLLAGQVLHHPQMLEYADAAQHFIFQDDQQHFYVSQAEVDMSHSAAWAPDDRAVATPYEVSDIGLPEWGIRHFDKPQADNKNWGATYRNVNGPSQVMQVFAARLMGVESAWNWPALFDYADRYYQTESGVGPDWFQALWGAYR
ncbi:MAG: hypothetical protein KC492_04845, partial [Myxococcales bacterium]|nr:hypothetical protein [Myxococcales bacterium]